jgi:hypothetical protein
MKQKDQEYQHKVTSIEEIKINQSFKCKIYEVTMSANIGEIMALVSVKDYPNPIFEVIGVLPYNHSLYYAEHALIKTAALKRFKKDKKS